MESSTARTDVHFAVLVNLVLRLAGPGSGSTPDSSAPDSDFIPTFDLTAEIA